MTTLVSRVIMTLPEVVNSASGKDRKMNEILKNMDAEKRDRIINAALEEFAKNGFDKASTNNIVKCVLYDFQT